MNLTRKKQKTRAEGIVNRTGIEQHWRRSHDRESEKIKKP